MALAKYVKASVSLAEYKLTEIIDVSGTDR